MRLKLDENLPPSLARALRALGHDADTVLDENLGGHDDPSVWRAAQATGRVLVTLDLDFSDVRVFAPGTHAGLVLVRLSDAPRRVLVERLRAAFADPDAETWAGCFVVVTEVKLRVRRP